MQQKGEFDTANQFIAACSRPSPEVVKVFVQFFEDQDKTDREQIQAIVGPLKISTPKARAMARQNMSPSQRIRWLPK